MIRAANIWRFLTGSSLRDEQKALRAQREELERLTAEQWKLVARSQGALSRLEATSDETDRVQAVYILQDEIGALAFGDDAPGDFLLFNCDVDEEDDRIDRVLLLDSATWMNLGMPRQLAVTLEAAR
jgi:hypothetical protein